MKLSRRQLLAAGVAAAGVGAPSRGEPQSRTAPQASTRAALAAPRAPNLPTRDYLSREARRITDNAVAHFKSTGDLPQVAGLLYPAEIVVFGELPATYAWAEDLYRLLGAPEKFRRGTVTSTQSAQ